MHVNSGSLSTPAGSDIFISENNMQSVLKNYTVVEVCSQLFNNVYLIYDDFRDVVQFKKEK